MDHLRKLSQEIRGGIRKGFEVLLVFQSLRPWADFLFNVLAELDLGKEVDVCHNLPNQIDFLRDYVASNKPLLMRGELLLPCL